MNSEQLQQVLKMANEKGQTGLLIWANWTIWDDIAFEMELGEYDFSRSRISKIEETTVTYFNNGFELVAFIAIAVEKLSSDEDFFNHVLEICNKNNYQGPFTLIPSKETINIKEESKMPNLKTFYGVWTTDDEMHGSFKAFAKTRELAEEELKKHYDFLCSTSPIPDDEHIIPLQMIVEGNNSLIDNLQDSNKKDKADESHKSITEKILEERERNRPPIELDLYVDPLDRPFKQPRHVLWDNHEESELGHPSDAFIRLFMCPEAYKGDEE